MMRTWIALPRHLPNARHHARPVALARRAALLASIVALAACQPGGGGGQGSCDDGLGDTELVINVPPDTSGTWWQPGVATTWTWQLQGPLNTSYDVDVYDVDLFDTSAMEIAALQAQGRYVLCYFSAGSWEEFRPDAAAFPVDARGNTLAGYPDERWLDIRRADVFALMEARLDLALMKGCDGVEPDNVTAFTDSTCFAIDADDQLAFNRNLFNAAHARDLTVALKNDLEQIPDLVDYVDLMVNEQCFQYDECDVLDPIIAAGKPVLNAEYRKSYRSNPGPVCDAALAADIRTLVLDVELDDSFRFSCDDDYP